MARGDLARGGGPRCQHTSLWMWRAEPGKLGGDLVGRSEGVVGEEDQLAPGIIGPGDELARAGQQLITAIDDAVQVEDEGAIVSQVLHRGCYPEICWRMASTSLRSAVFSLTSRLIFSQPCSTVLWSRPPSDWPI